MFGLITMLLSTLGATGMGSMLKIVAGIVDRIGAAKESAQKREIIREMQLRKADIEFQKEVFGGNDDASMFTRGTRRIIALIGMLNFATISILCTIYPSVELITFIPPANITRRGLVPSSTRSQPRTPRTLPLPLAHWLLVVFWVSICGR